MLRTGALVIGLLGCSCSRPLPQTQMVAVTPAATRVTCAADADCDSRQLCVDRMCYDVASAMACSDSPIHFTTNSAAINSRNRAELNQLAVCLRSDQSVKVSVAGNADERGNRDYNRSLAQRRADAVAGYLQSAGIRSEQLSTMTYGVDNPTCTEHDSNCWRRNRRVDIAASSAHGTAVKNKQTTDDDTKNGRRIDSTGNGTDNGSPIGK
jgi:outer membrane protein OmpA-like peptidoglycan-associated protein